VSDNYQRIEALAAVIRESKGANQELLLELILMILVVRQ
jgi:hypothetical protein